MRVLHILAVLLLVAGIVWVLTSATSMFRPVPRALGEIGGVRTTLPLPVEEVEAVFDQASNAMLEANSAGNRWKVATQIFSWIGFFLATAITALSAFFGSSIDPKQVTADNALRFVRRRVSRHAWIVGTMAAGIAASTAITERLDNVALAQYARADAIRQLLDSTRTSLLSGESLTAAQARGLLDRLQIESQR